MIIQFFFTLTCEAATPSSFSYKRLYIQKYFTELFNILMDMWIIFMALFIWVFTNHDLPLCSFEPAPPTCQSWLLFQPTDTYSRACHVYPSSTLQQYWGQNETENKSIRIIKRQQNYWLGYKPFFKNLECYNARIFLCCFLFANPWVKVKSQYACMDESLNKSQLNHSRDSKNGSLIVLLDKILSTDDELYVLHKIVSIVLDYKYDSK